MTGIIFPVSLSLTFFRLLFFTDITAPTCQIYFFSGLLIAYRSIDISIIIVVAVKRILLLRFRARQCILVFIFVYCLVSTTT